MSEIKPCPFCGGSALLRMDDDPGYPFYMTFDHERSCVMYAVPTDLFRSFATDPDADAAWNSRASEACASVQRERDALREMLGEAAREIRALQRGYVGTLEHARDRIIRLGGECDPLERMEAYDPHLIASRAFLSRYEGEVK